MTLLLALLLQTASPDRPDLVVIPADGLGFSDGRCKLVTLKGGPWELYDLEKDRTELSDFAAKEPGRVGAMSAAGAAATWKRR